jgi:hypothetical protein
MEKVTLLVDPRSPWCFQASRWLRSIEEAGEVDLDWALFSLELVNLNDDENAEAASFVAHYGPALRTAVLVRDRFGSKEMGKFYSALGGLMWASRVPDEFASERSMYVTTVGDKTEQYRTDDRSIAELSETALVEIGRNADLVQEAMADPATWTAVVDETRRWADTIEAFGVPTLIFHDHEDAAVFGPVLMSKPGEAESKELWENLTWLVGTGYFFELKKARDPKQLRVDLPNGVDRTATRVELLREARPLVADKDGSFAGHSQDWMIAHLVEEHASN